ncbi:MAG: RagB/SusD family nutrient uptake outer membrane protein [Cyclobacteriaceae bacterium]|nr:RagB/SusD family nutrient uptake outer membrane protein [Cyclobacteriaceae bacterium]
MKNKISVILVALLSFLTLSCGEDYLDTVPTASVDAEAAFLTTKNAKAAVNGIYRLLYAQYDYGNQSHANHSAMLFLWDTMGDDLVIPTTNNSGGLSDARWIAHRSDQDVATIMPYRLYYQVIVNTNLAIANIDNATGLQEDRDQLKGEVYALRAWAYFNLVQMYGKRYVGGTTNSQLGVPLILEPITQGQPRATVEEVYTQINADLDEAIALLSSTQTVKSHPDKEVAKGLKARVALVQQNWALAETLANEARQGIALMTPAQYQSGFSNITVGEWMWGADHIETQTAYFWGFHSYMSCNFNSTAIRVNPRCVSKSLYDQIPATDVRSKMWAPIANQAATVAPPGGTKPAYMGQKFRLDQVAPATSYMGDVPYMRAAEMYLIEAEAQARQNKDTDAQNTLKALVVVRNPSYVTSANTGTALIDEILFHRRIELWGEGFRFFDLKRMNQPLNRNGSNFVSGVIAGLFDVPAGDIRWEYVIPRDELNSNKAAVQNPL